MIAIDSGDTNKKPQVTEQVNVHPSDDDTTIKK